MCSMKSKIRFDFLGKKQSRNRGHKQFQSVSSCEKLPRVSPIFRSWVSRSFKTLKIHSNFCFELKLTSKKKPLWCTLQSVSRETRLENHFEILSWARMTFRSSMIVIHDPLEPKTLHSQFSFSSTIETSRRNDFGRRSVHQNPFSRRSRTGEAAHKAARFMHFWEILCWVEQQGVKNH